MKGLYKGGGAKDIAGRLFTPSRDTISLIIPADELSAVSVNLAHLSALGKQSRHAKLLSIHSTP